MNEFIHVLSTPYVYVGRRNAVLEINPKIGGHPTLVNNEHGKLGVWNEFVICNVIGKLIANQKTYSVLGRSEKNHKERRFC